MSVLEVAGVVGFTRHLVFSEKEDGKINARLGTAETDIEVGDARLLARQLCRLARRIEKRKGALT